MDAELPYIEAKGTYREVGRQIGEAERELVLRELDYYGEQFVALAGFSFAEAVERARPYLRPAEEAVPQIVDQLRGLAEGTGVPFEHLFAANCNEELTCLPEQAERPEHCTSFAFKAGGRTVAGHNEELVPGRHRVPHGAARHAR
jgi:isopenicillin-N N-acyltransferase like protein